MRYRVIITPSAEEDIESSYLWGCRAWGKPQAKKWAQQLRAAIRELAKFPKRCPLAPEASEFPIEIRQLIVGRYRVLFTIMRNTVYVLHVRGAYVEDESKG